MSKTRKKGAMAETVGKKRTSTCTAIAPPDFPSLEPTPSITALALILSSFDKGINASSFVVSKKVNFAERQRLF